MLKKHLVAILATIAVAGLVCYYLYTTNAAYDGGLLDGMMTFFITMPLLGGTGLWRILTGRLEKPTKQKWWQVALYTLLLLAVFAFVVYDLVASRFYSLQSMIFVVLFMALLPIAYLEHRRGNKPTKNPVRTWASAFIAMYLSIFATVATYVQVVQPVTVEQATAIVAEAYGEDSYQFHSHLDFHQDDNPMGVYWFAQHYADGNGWVEVDLVSGSVSVV